MNYIDILPQIRNNIFYVRIVMTDYDIENQMVIRIVARRNDGLYKTEVVQYPNEGTDYGGEIIVPMFGMAKSIKRGNGWARIELVDETGSIGLFHNEETPIETGQMYFILVGDNRIARYIKVSEVDPNGTDLFVDYLYRKEYDMEEDEKMVVNFSPYKTKAGKTMAHIVMTDKDKNLTRAIAFPTMYSKVLGKMREGMKSKPVLSKLDDGTLMIKEIK